MPKTINSLDELKEFLVDQIKFQTKKYRRVVNKMVKVGDFPPKGHDLESIWSINATLQTYYDLYGLITQTDPFDILGVWWKTQDLKIEENKDNEIAAHEVNKNYKEEKVLCRNCLWNGSMNELLVAGTGMTHWYECPICKSPNINL